MVLTLAMVTASAVDAAAQGAAGAASPVATSPARTRPARLEDVNRSLADARRRQALAPTLDNERRLAASYRAAGVLDAALAHYEAALRLDPHDAASLDGTARIWRDWGYLDIALPHAYRAVFWSSGAAAAETTLGTVLLKLGLADAAREHFELARRRDPHAAYPLNNLCYLELQRARAADAVPLCEQATALEPSSQTIRNNLATAYALSGNLDAAFAVFGSGTARSISAYNEGVLWLAAQEPARAREAFGRARTADPSFGPPLARLRALSSRQENR